MNKVPAYSLFGLFFICLSTNELVAKPHPSEDGIANNQPRATLIEALQPPKRARPVIAIIGSNDGAETTDYIIPYGVLQRADVAEVFALATRPGPLKLVPALTIQPDSSTDIFDNEYPQGADYVIVPAMHNPNDPQTPGRPSA